MMATFTKLSTEERLDRLEEALVQLADDVGHVSMNQRATRREVIVQIRSEHEAAETAAS
jgi:type IV secretory pathway ATPase VirB11/archaellum biosynthesis ATPase